jgi:hypothetical protein
METLYRRMSRVMGSAAGATGRLRQVGNTKNILEALLNVDHNSPR